jgi:hypothetical protein
MPEIRKCSHSSSSRVFWLSMTSNTDVPANKGKV